MRLRPIASRTSSSCDSGAWIGLSRVGGAALRAGPDSKPGGVCAAGGLTDGLAGRNRKYATAPTTPKPRSTARTFIEQPLLSFLGSGFSGQDRDGQSPIIHCRILPRSNGLDRILPLDPER